MSESQPLNSRLSIEERLEQLEAKQSITEVLHRYARGWDRLDEQAIRSCFHPDATHQHGGFEGASSEFITLGLQAVADFPAVFHMIGNISIELQGQSAATECYFMAYQRRPIAGSTDMDDWFLLGRYVDRFEQRNGEWKIAHRIGLHDGSRTFVPADESLQTAPADQLSQRNTTDAWYQILGSDETFGA